MGTEEYRRMQEQFYNSIEPTDDKAKYIIGNFEAHENYPYEDHLLVDVTIPATRPLQALDFGCGAGRMIRRMWMRGVEADGVDISQPMLDVARRWSPVGTHLYKTNGMALDTVPSSHYDLVYCTISFQHIASYEMRMMLLHEFLRVLRPGGRIALQIMWSDQGPHAWPGHVSWRDSRDGAAQTNGMCDVVICEANLGELRADLESIGFTKMDYHVAEPPHAHHGFKWFYLRAVKPE